MLAQEDSVVEMLFIIMHLKEMINHFTREMNSSKVNIIFQYIYNISNLRQCSYWKNKIGKPIF